MQASGIRFHREVYGERRPCILQRHERRHVSRRMQKRIPGSAAFLDGALAALTLAAWEPQARNCCLGAAALNRVRVPEARRSIPCAWETTGGPVSCWSWRSKVYP
jgi:hypothetical protein